MLFRYRLARLILGLIQFTLTATKVTGREHIPTKGPYIVVLNHTSVADTPILCNAFPLMPWRFFAGEKWRTHWLYGPIMGWLGAIYINRGEADRQALREALRAIKAGAVFGVAPEGSRSENGILGEARDGTAYVATRANVPIIPIGLVDVDSMFANAKKFKRSSIEVNIGQPFTLPDLGRRVRGKDLAAYTHLIMVNIAAQLPERYHGLYADSPALAALQSGDDPWAYCLQLIEPQMAPTEEKRP